uniref:SLH domain-containing protein n=1 Tax=Arundo donax TaxID=35708 RepID=A0A0A9DM14_ARUDO
MAVAPYTLRLSLPPRHGAPLLPQLRPQLRRHAAAKVAASWATAGGDSDDGVGGWWVPEQPVEQERRTGFGRAIAVGLGASAAIAVAGLAWHSPSSRKCLQQLIVAPIHYVQEKLSTLESLETPKEDASGREPDENEVPSTLLDEKSEVIIDDLRQNHRNAGGSHVSIQVPMDPIHEEAFSILKKLKIIEEDVSSSDFCTRREFARWFVKLCSKFERKRMHRITPNKLTSGSVHNAFDDVNIDDPDFLYIQSLGESGIVPSKLSNSLGTSASASPSCKGNSKFLPDSYLSRFDLINWKVLVEHPETLEIDQKFRC